MESTREIMEDQKDNNRWSEDTYRALFESLFQMPIASVILTDSDLNVVRANQRTSEIFDVTREDLKGLDCRQLISMKDREDLDRALSNLAEGETWAKRVWAHTNSGQTFPIEMNVRRVALGAPSHFLIMIYDLSHDRDLELRLQQEKTHRREMYITLRNVMDSVGKEKRGTEKLIAYKIENMLLPTLDKTLKEPSEIMRNSYLNILRRELLGITKAFPKELDIPFLRLTRTEMKVCQYIQAGYSGKEVADALNISFETIQTHRKNIRKKLGLRDKKISLYTFLSTRRSLGEITRT
jgi:PAS domain S-box-containing protein